MSDNQREYTVKDRNGNPRTYTRVCVVEEGKTVIYAKVPVVDGDTISDMGAMFKRSYKDSVGYYKYKINDPAKKGGAKDSVKSNSNSTNEHRIYPGTYFYIPLAKSIGLNRQYVREVKEIRPEIFIGVFFDGTGNDDTDPNKYSNVYNLSQLYIEDKGIQGYCYVPGVGTETDFKVGGKSIKKPTWYTGNALGWKREEKIIKALKKIEGILDDCKKLNKVYPGKVTIDVFGFSRGAAIARHFVNLIDQNKFKLGYKYSSVKFDIRFLGVFDTVGSFGATGDNDDDGFEFHIDNIKVKYAYHIIAQNEYREKFNLQSLFTGTDQSKFLGYPSLKSVGIPMKRFFLDGDIIEEIGVGVHSDIGGGYHRTEKEQACNNNLLSLIYLKKMHAKAVEKGVPFNAINYKKLEIDVKMLHEAERLHSEIEKYYDDYPGLLDEHMKYTSVEYYLHTFEYKREIERSFIKAQADKYQDIKDYSGYRNKQDELLDKEIVKNTMIFFDKQTNLIKENAFMYLEKHKQKMIIITGSSDTVSSFLLTHNKLRDGFMHCSHYPDNMAEEFFGIGNKANIEKEYKFKRGIFLNRKHVDEIETIRSEAYESDKIKSEMLELENSDIG